MHLNRIDSAQPIRSRHVAQARRGPARLLIAAVATLAVLLNPLVRAQTATDEYRLKAAYVYKFPQFVEWPAAAGEPGSFDICVYPPNPFGTMLRELVEGQRVTGRAVRVRLLERDAPFDNCQVLFVPDAASDGPAVLQRASTLPLLTVGDSPMFLDDGGIVRLRIVSDRVRFEVNLTAATRAGLRLSSQLLRLAVVVRGRPA